MKRVIMTHKADGTEEYVCRVCGQSLRHCDNGYDTFGRGEVESVGSEFLYCDVCGYREDYPKTKTGKLPEVRF